MTPKLLGKLKEKAKNILKDNTRFHDFGHALEVLANVKKLLVVEGTRGFDKDILFTAALFHDASNLSNSEKEGLEGAEITEKALLKLKEFPKNKIPDVKRLIIAHTTYGEKKRDEILFEAADQMAAFSDLGLLRSFMIFGKADMKVDEAIKDELSYLEKRFRKFKLESARDLVKEKYFNKKRILEKLLSDLNS